MKKFWGAFAGQRLRFSWAGVRDYSLVILGALVQALALRIFLVPAQLVNGGVAGMAQILNYYTDWPIGLMIFVGNLPLFVIGWRYLGGPRFALRTAVAVIAVSFFADALVWLPFMPLQGLTQDPILNTLYGGVISGFGFGLVYRGQGTSGGSDILARMLTNRFNIPISQSYMITDALIMFLASLSFSWENALYALVMLYISGIAAEGVMEGSNVVRTALIITANPDPVAQQILTNMERGVTLINGKGAYTGADRTVLYSVITRSEVAQLKALVREVDPAAFIVIGQAHEALGEGFKPLAEP